MAMVGEIGGGVIGAGIINFFRKLSYVVEEKKIRKKKHDYVRVME